MDIPEINVNCRQCWTASRKMSVSEIPPAVGQLWTLEGIILKTALSLAWQLLAQNSYVSSNWHFKWVWCHHLESADEGTLTLWNVQNCSTTTLHHTEEDLNLQKQSCENLKSAYIIFYEQCFFVFILYTADNNASTGIFILDKFWITFQILNNNVIYKQHSYNGILKPTYHTILHRECV